MSYIQTVSTKHTIGPKAIKAFEKINQIQRRDDVIHWITTNVKKEIDPNIIKDFADLMMSRRKWSAPRLVRVWECSPLRKLFLLHLATNYPEYEPHRGSYWMVKCIQAGDERRQVSIVGSVQRTLALEKLSALGLDISELN